MNQRAVHSLVIIQLVLLASSGLLFAQASPSGEAVTCRTNRTLLQQSGGWTLLTNEMTMPGGIKVFTNGTFRVNDGKIRLLKEGQILRADGNLLSADGSIMPVLDHIAMTKGSVMVFKDGEGQALAATLTLSDGSVINPDGSYSRPSGRRSRLVDGQLLTLQGAPLAGLDTISLRNGKVVVYRAGALIPLESANVNMGMYDGTRVNGEGVITSRDGTTTTRLTEGQIITVEGVRADW
jgi:hypothetical protein